MYMKQQSIDHIFQLIVIENRHQEQLSQLYITQLEEVRLIGVDITVTYQKLVRIFWFYLHWTTMMLL
jgi:predicted protein tyrosine phosphatase